MNDSSSGTETILPLLEFDSVSKRYSSDTVLDNISMRIGRGRIIGLLGPNGSGKTTIIKLINGLLTPTSGKVLINGLKPGVESKKAVSYLPDRSYINSWMKVSSIIQYFCDFYEDFDKNRAYGMLRRLSIAPDSRLGSLSKGTREKVQLILVMSRRAQLYVLDEPIGGVDPAARDFILDTIISNYTDTENSTVLISTHLIADIEKILDDVMFLSGGRIILAGSADDIIKQNNMSVDELFREVYRC